jgi:hypothetical protein
MGVSPYPDRYRIIGPLVLRECLSANLGQKLPLGAFSPPVRGLNAHTSPRAADGGRWIYQGRCQELIRSAAEGCFRFEPALFPQPVKPTFIKLRLRRG